MRKYFYRGKRLDNGEWEKGQLKSIHKGSATYGTAYYILDIYGQSRLARDEVDENTIGQYTGFKDAKLNLIFEDDIIKGKENTMYQIIREKCNLYVYDMNTLRMLDIRWLDKMTDIEVIGNAIDNKEISLEFHENHCGIFKENN